MGNFKRMSGEFWGPNWGKKEASLIWEAAYIRPLQRRVFWPWHQSINKGCMSNSVKIYFYQSLNLDLSNHFLISKLSRSTHVISLPNNERHQSMKKRSVKKMYF
jgi:hypothetical protein